MKSYDVQFLMAAGLRRDKTVQVLAENKYTAVLRATERLDPNAEKPLTVLAVNRLKF